jgi:hypothetical protein
MAVFGILCLLAAIGLAVWIVLRSGRKTDIEKKHKELVKDVDEVLDDAEKKRRKVDEEIKNESKKNIARRFFDAFRRKPGQGG